MASDMDEIESLRLRLQEAPEDVKEKDVECQTLKEG